MIDFPVKYAADREMIKESKAADEAVLKGKNVLLCEDNFVNMEIAELLLKEKGMIFDNSCCHCIKEILEMFCR